MKTTLLVRSLLLVARTAAIGLLTPALYATTTEEQAVPALVQAMFDGMAKRNAAAIKESLLHDGTMVVMRNGTLTQMTFEAFADRVQTSGKAHIEERIHDPLIRIKMTSQWYGRRLYF